MHIASLLNAIFYLKEDKNFKFLADFDLHLVLKTKENVNNDWSSENLKNFFIFLLNKPELMKNFTWYRFEDQLKTIMKREKDLDIIQASVFSLFVRKFYPEFSEKFSDTFINKFESCSSFNYFSIDNIVIVSRELFDLDCQFYIQFSVHPLPKNLASLIDELQKKINSENFFQFFRILNICRTFSNNLFNEKIFEFLIEKYHTLITHNPFLVENLMVFESLLIIIEEISTKQASKDKIKQLLNFIQNAFFYALIQSSEIINSSFELFPAILILVRLQIKFETIHILLLNHIICNINWDKSYSYDNKKNKLLFFESLVALNYKNIISKNPKTLSKFNFLINTIKADFNFTSELSMINKFNFLTELIKFLWGLCVFDIYDDSFVNNKIEFIASIINSQDNTYYNQISADTFKLFYQVCNWIKYEKKNDLECFNVMDSQSSSEIPQDIEKNEEIRNQVQKIMGLLDKNYIQNFYLCPYVFDFADPQSKSAIIIEDSKVYLDQEKKVPNKVFQLIRNRHLTAMGWSLNIITFEN